MMKHGRAKRTKEQRRAERRAFYLRHRERLLREMKEYRDHKRDRMKAAEVEVELLELKDAGHGFKGADAEQAEAALFGFFDRHLKKPS